MRPCRDTPDDGAMAPLEERDVPRRILAYLRGHEGAHFREVQRALALATGQADHHLRALVAEGLLVRAPLGGEVHYFPASRPRHERLPLAALRSGPRLQLAGLVRARAPVGLRELARATGMPESTLAHHLRVLVRAGVLFKVEERGRVAYAPTDGALLAKLLPVSALATPA
ncbi:MAG: helix-turn-helix domain-containing protein [Halobacteriales archaeon]|nr:helix-turn-helix domain-containing protein [Halobacteriales archaeon]